MQFLLQLLLSHAALEYTDNKFHCKKVMPSTQHEQSKPYQNDPSKEQHLAQLKLPYSKANLQSSKSQSSSNNHRKNQQAKKKTQ